MSSVNNTSDISEVPFSASLGACTVINIKVMTNLKFAAKLANVTTAEFFLGRML